MHAVCGIKLPYFYSNVRGKMGGTENKRDKKKKKGQTCFFLQQESCCCFIS